MRGNALVDRLGSNDADRSTRADLRIERICDCGVWTYSGTVYGPTVLDIRVEAYRHSVLYVNLVSVVDCSVLSWIEQRDLRRLASDDRLFGKTSEPG